MKKKIYLIAFLFIAIPSIVFANGAVFRAGAYGGLQAAMENKIKMTKEEVIFDASRIDLSSFMASLESVPVKCTFYFKNISEYTIDTKMGFPFMQSIEKFQDVFKLDFVTFIDGKKTSIKKDSNDTYPEIYIWNIKFLPKEDKKVVCTYNGFADAFSGDGSGERWTFRYITHTGGFWATPIGTAKFTFLMPSGAEEYSYKTLEYGKRKIHKIQPENYTYTKEKIEWTFINWRPDTVLSNTPWIRNLSKDDILIIFEEMYLSDFKEYYELKKYEGNVRVYGKEDIRTVFTRDQFDRENEFDLQYLRLLRNEIFARKGMIFKDPDLDLFFRAMSWYKADSIFSKDALNNFERKNIEIIINEENICRAQNDTALIINVDLHFRDIFKKKVYIGNKYVYSVKDLDNKRPRNKMYARLLLNEIYARHGLIFKSFLMKSFFEPFTWYEPKVTLVTDFNEYEKQNILLLKKYLQKE